MLLGLQKKQVHCLVQLYRFEAFWTFYSLSGGELYADYCHEATLNLLEAIRDVAIEEPGILEIDALRQNPHQPTDSLLYRLESWVHKKSKWPFDTSFMSRAMAFSLCSDILIYLLRELGLSNDVGIVWSSNEIDKAGWTMRWSQHMPRRYLHRINGSPEIIARLNSSPSIVVVADIRSSQDLMTYAKSAEDFAERMAGFFAIARRLVDKHCGFFDKFTGDGFIAYFNAGVHNDPKIEPGKAFTAFVLDLHQETIPLFEEWSRSVRKLPLEKVGLAIGADCGMVAFRDTNMHLVAVGDAVVWANRMCAVAKAGEVVVNNRLVQELGTDTTVSFEERPGSTKTGEAFMAQVLRIVCPVEAGERLHDGFATGRETGCHPIYGTRNMETGEE